MAVEVFVKVFKLLFAKVRACLSVEEFQAEKRDHEHPYPKKVPTKRLSGLVPATKDHEHPYVREKDHVTENAWTLDGKDWGFFAKKGHDHEGIYAKREQVNSARAILFGKSIVSPRIFSTKDHEHPEYVARGERVKSAKRLGGVPPSGVSKRSHEHPCVKKDDPRYRKKDAKARLAKGLVKGELYVLRCPPRSGVVKVSGNAPLTNLIGYSVFASLAEVSVEEVVGVFGAVPEGGVRRCMEYVTSRPVYNASTGRAVTKYLILFVPLRIYQKLSQVLSRCAVAMSYTTPSVRLSVDFHLSLVDAEGRGRPIGDFVQGVVRAQSFWIPLVPPQSTSILSLLDQAVHFLGVSFLIFISFASLLVAVVVNTVLDALISVLDGLTWIPLVGGAFAAIRDALLTLCVKPIGIFRVMGGGALVPIVFVQTQWNDPPTHWLTGGRVFGVSVFVRNVYQVVNGFLVKLDGRRVVEAAGVVGGHFDDLEAATRTYCRQFEAHFPAVFYRQPLAGYGPDVAVLGHISVGRYTRPFDPRAFQCGPQVSGQEVLMKVPGLPFTVVCLTKKADVSPSKTLFDYILDLVSVIVSILTGKR